MMKKVLIIAVLAVFGLTNVNAQEASNGYEKGDVFISGAIGYGSESTEINKSNTFEISPGIGFFVSENIAIGVQFGYKNNKSKNVIGNTTTTTEDISTVSLGGFGRYYFMPDNEFSLFAELAVGYVSRENNLTEFKVNGFGVGFAPGISYFLSDHFALEATFGIFSYASAKPADSEESADTFRIGLDMSNINFGIVYKL